MTGPATDERRVATGANAVLVTVLVVVIAIVATQIARQFALRLDLSSEGLLDLDPDTVAALQLAEGRGLTITAFSPQAKDGEAVLRDRALRDFTTTLAQQGDVTVQHVDFDRDRLVAERMGVDRYGTVVVEARGDRVDIKDRELFRARGKKGERTVEFIGEGAVAAAIRKVVAGSSTVVYLTTGHGEREIFDRGLGELKALAQVFESQGWTAKNIDLLRDVTPADGLPADAAAVLVLGPRAPFAEAEQELLRSYVGRGGSLGLWVEPGSGVTWLEDVGLAFPSGTVLDPTHVASRPDQPVLGYGRHPITEALAADGLATVVSVAAPVESAPRDGVTASALLQTSRLGWIERGTEAPAVYTPASDGAGPAVVAVAATVAAPHPWATAGKAGRIAVTGDTDGLGDELLDGAPGNATYLTNVVRWLVRSDEPVGGRVGRPKRIRTLALSESQLSVVRGLLVFGMPSITAIAGALLLWTRRAR